MQLYWEICLIDLFTHLNRIIQLTLIIIFSFIANMVKQKDLEWYVFDIIEAQDNFQGKDDINWFLFDLILNVSSTIFQTLIGRL